MNFAEWNDEMATLARRWKAWPVVPFPSGCAGLNLNGVELVLINSYIANLLRSAVERRPLGLSAADQLEQAQHELTAVLPMIPAHGRPYFEELVGMAGLAVRLGRAAAT